MLVFKSLIDRQENVKLRFFSGCEKLAILKSSESGVSSCLALLTRQGIAESLIDALIDQNAHLGTCKQELFCFFESSEGRITRHGRKPLEKIFQRFSAFQIGEKSLDGHPRSAKHRCSAENFGISNYDPHEAIVSREVVADAWLHICSCCHSVCLQVLSASASGPTVRTSDHVASGFAQCGSAKRLLLIPIFGTVTPNPRTIDRPQP